MNPTNKISKKMDRILQNAHHMIRNGGGKSMRMIVEEMDEQISKKFPEYAAGIIEISTLTGGFLEHNTGKRFTRHYALISNGKIFDPLYPFPIKKEHYAKRAYKNPDNLFIREL